MVREVPVTKEELIDVRQAAVLVSRHPETIRRWVGSGRVAARRRGNRLYLARAEIQAVAGQEEVAADLRAWADQVREARAGVSARASRSAADLVIEDRASRSNGERARARR